MPPLSAPRPARSRALLAVALLAGGCAIEEPRPRDTDRPVAPGATAAGTIEGVVTDVEGAPLAGARVTSEPGGVEGTTGADGAFALARLLPGTYRVVAAADGMEAGWSDPVEVVADAVATVAIPLAAEATAAGDGELRVRVEGPDELPREGARVTAIDDAGAEVVGETDANGAVTLAGLAGVVVDVVVEDPDGRLWPRAVGDVSVPALGGADVAVRLSGRPADGTAWVGTPLCALCHAEVAAAVAETAHARGISALEGEPAAAFETGATIDLGDATATLGLVDGAAAVTLTDASGESRSYAVAGLLGGADRGAIPWTEKDGAAWPLPVAWVPGDPDREGFDDPGWVAGDTTPWLTDAGAFASDDLPDPAASAEASCFGCHATGYTLEDAGGGAVAMRAAGGGDARWDEAGIGCERCHGPGQDHTSGPLDEKPFRVTNPANLDADRANEVCGQCHAALAGEAGTPYPWDTTHGLFTPGEALADHADSAFEAWSSGAARVPGASADELAASLHGTGDWQARCTDCHDPHGSSTPADLRVDHRDNGLCLSCHAGRTFGGSDDAAEDHAGHPVYQPEQPPQAGRCTGCHMPATATRLGWHDASAAGTLASHRFVAIPPSDTLASFDAAGADTLAPGEFVVNACQECHAFNDWLFDGAFPGPTGDMTERATHEALSGAFLEWYP
ncbi:MAG: carboxypeptidase regulatory-like domain-containing protein [Myxococcota bacterium]